MKTIGLSQKLIARAGSLYLAMILTGIFVHLFVRAGIIEPGNAAVTAQNLLNKEFIFRLGFVLDLIYMVSFIFLGLVFYRLFQQTDKNQAHALLSIVLVSSAMMGLNMLNQFAAQYVLSGAEFLNVFQPEQLQAFSLFFLDLHNHGMHIGYLFFGLWLFSLGYLVMKSDLFPGVFGKIFGGLLIAGFVGYEINFLTYFLFPDKYAIVSSFSTIPANLGELSLCVWLIFKGAIRKDKHRVVYSAINKTK
jgi:hypothetical protein